ncbi:hypothetical protein [Streptomyces sp. NPDC001678]|uniref:hypothetical protein n=1 Tax=Streptomyces sp. NPDC001678 TaxID=3364599 RepID=UPI0036A82E5D
MEYRPFVVVHAPDDRGLRAVSVRGKVVGKAWSRRELLRLLRRAGLPKDPDLDDRARVLWLEDPDCWPDRPWRRRAEGAVMVLGLGASAAVLFRVGAVDVFQALAYGWRVLGIVLLLAALAEVIGIVAVFDYWGKRSVRYSGEGVLLGVITVTATTFMFLIVQIQGGDYTPYLWLWVFLLLWCGWAFRALSRRKAWRSVPHPRRFAVGVVVSAAVGAASASYSAMYVPYATPVNVPFATSFGTPVLNARRTVLHVPAHVTFRNSGSITIYVVGTLWSVSGLPSTFVNQGNGVSDWKNDLTHGNSTLRHERFSPSRMLGTGVFVDAGSRLDPGDDFSQDFTVQVPLSADLGRVRVQAQVSYIRADRCKLGNSYASSIQYSWNPDSPKHEHVRDAPDWVAAPGDEFFRYESRLYHSSEVLNITRAPDYAAMWWVLPKWNDQAGFAKGDTDPYMTVDISRAPEGKETLSESEQEPYGMKTMWSGTDQTVDQLLKKAGK